MWDGGDPDCDHRSPGGGVKRGLGSGGVNEDGSLPDRHKYAVSERVFADVCGKCGARRVDQQLGLEPTPDLFVERIVAVFRQVRRVLAPHGTCWINLGDTYAANRTYQVPDNKHRDVGNSMAMRVPAASSGLNDEDGLIPAPAFEHGLKPKDLVGIPWRVAFALQQDGWWLRADVIWAKPNPMPESVTDRPTKAHEYVFLLTKAPRYYFDQEAVREGVTGNAHSEGRGLRPKRSISDPASVRTFDTPTVPTNRNVRSVWQIATQPYPEAHFATYPEELVRRCVLAGCPVRVCRVCGKPSERIVEREAEAHNPRAGEAAVAATGGAISGGTAKSTLGGFTNGVTRSDLGWSDCEHNDWRPGTVLDPFIGSGTTCKVARDHGRHSIGIDLSADYLNLAARRLQQLSLLT